MRNVVARENHRFRRELVQIRRVNLHASVASERIRALLVRKKKNQVRFSLCGHELCQRTKSGLTINCNVVALFASPFSRERRINTRLCNRSWQRIESFTSHRLRIRCFILRMKRFLISHVFSALLISMAHAATNFELAAKATNDLGVDLQRKLATGDENLCISPYSIDSALAMTFAGADSETRNEMARVLHFPNGSDVPASFSALQNSLEQMSAKTAELAKDSKKFGGPSEPITLNIANRLFAQKGYHFRDAYLSLVKQNFGGAFEPLDFVADPAAATQRINKWVADQTRDRIRDLIPGGALDKTTRLVLANALYLKAPWASEFSQNATKSQLFFVRGAPVDVPMMRKTDKNFGYARREGFTVVRVPYAGNDLQFVVLLPDDINGLRELESKLSAEILAGCAKLEKRDV